MIRDQYVEKAPLVMMIRAALLSTLALLSQAQSPEVGCCYRRIVSGTADNLDGEFILVRDGAQAQDPMCHQGCVYKRYIRYIHRYKIPFYNVQTSPLVSDPEIIAEMHTASKMFPLERQTSRKNAMPQPALL